MLRKIIHVDMDCFFAAIEMRDNPALQGHPVAVGGVANRRGVLSTCNYTAREYGLHAAMPTITARRLCPHLVLLPVNMPKYQAVSEEIHCLLAEYTEHIEPVSVDEAYLDVTDSECYRGSATWIAEAILRDIQAKTGLTASAGVAPNKLLAKIASDWHKPNGLCVITPEQIPHFMEYLLVQKLPGVGPVTAGRMANLSIYTCADLARLSLPYLLEQFGRFGAVLYERCRGIDPRPLETHRIRKSISVEETYLYDLPTLDHCLQQLPLLYKKLSKRVSSSSHPSIIKLFMKIKFCDFEQTTVEMAARSLTIPQAQQLLARGFYRHSKPVRLLGLGVRLGQPETASGWIQQSFN